MMCSREQVDYITKDTGENAQPLQMNLFHIAPCPQINSKWIKDSNLKAKKKKTKNKKTVKQEKNAC